MALYGTVPPFQDPGIPIVYMLPQHEPSCFRIESTQTMGFSQHFFALNMDRFLHCPGGHGAFPNRLGQMFHEIQMYTRIQKSVQTTLSMGFSGTDWLEVPTIYFWPIFQAYVRGYNPQNMAWYGTVPPF